MSETRKQQVFVGLQSLGQLPPDILPDMLVVCPLGIILAVDQNDAYQKAKGRWPDQDKLMVAPWEKVDPGLRRTAVAKD